MFSGFFLELRKAGVPVSLKEYLVLMEAMSKGVADYGVERFYYLSRACLVKDERLIDKFDRVFAHIFQGIENEISIEILLAEIPESWLRNLAERILTEEEKKQVEGPGGLEKLMELLAQRLREQKGRHEGGNKWIGTLGTSPFGAQGYNPEGVRIGQDKSRNRSATKIWEKREFKNLDDDIELGTRNLKVALRRLRRFAREGAPTELDLPGTIRSTAHQGGMLDIQMRPERHNLVKVLLLLDIGGSMDDHVRLCEELFSAARMEFKHLEHYYFHNCPYDHLWKDSRRRESTRAATWDVIRSYSPDWKLIFVGDAAMASYEITHPGGSIEYRNEESGEVWMERLLGRFPKAAWLNPVPELLWRSNASTGVIKRIIGNRMFTLTPAGIDKAARELSR